MNTYQEQDNEHYIVMFLYDTLILQLASLFVPLGSLAVRDPSLDL